MQLKSQRNSGMKPLVNLVPSLDHLQWDALVMPHYQRDREEDGDEDEREELDEVVVPPPRQFSVDHEQIEREIETASNCVDGEVVAGGMTSCCFEVCVFEIS